MNISTRRITIIGGCVALIAFIGGCAKEVSTDTSHMAKDYFDAWMSVNHPGLKPSGLGIYILDDTPGTGVTLTDDDIYVFAEYTVSDIDGNISSTTKESLSQQLGEYNAVNYYGAKILVNDRAYTETGILEMLKGMKVGGRRTAIIPSWLYTIADYETEDEYLEKNGGTNAIVSVEIKDKAQDITAWEIDTLQRFVALKMNGRDSIKFGYYAMTLKEPVDTATFGEDTTFYINYTGRLLNGHVFDTTVEDTAKVYGIYSPSKTYSPMCVTMTNEYKNITIGENSAEAGNTTIDGFAFCLSRMRPMEKVLCAFYSALGYSYSGSGSSIPMYAPLTFEIEAVESPEGALL